jgi:hypothetical protein
MRPCQRTPSWLQPSVQENHVRGVDRTPSYRVFVELDSIARTYKIIRIPHLI